MKSKTWLAKICIRQVLGLLCLPVLGLAQSIYIQPGASVTVSGGGTIRLEGTFENNGTFTAGDGKVVFQEVVGNGTPEISGNSPTSFNNIDVNLSTKTLRLLRSIGVEGTVNFVGGLFNLNGFDLTLGTFGLLSNESESNRFIGPSGGRLFKTVNLNAPVGANPGNLGAVISSASNLGMTTISRSHVPANIPGIGASIERSFDISPANNTGLDATLRFNYFDAELNGLSESTLSLWKDNGGGWSLQGFTTRDNVLNFLELNHVSSFSEWTAAIGCKDGMGNPVPPTTFYRDQDGDGFGNSDEFINTCSQPIGYVTLAGDCDDMNVEVNPSALEVCDGFDNNCNGMADEGGNTPPAGWNQGNIGGANNATSSFNCSNGTVFNITSQGFSSAGNADLVNSNFQQICGNASITAHIVGSPAPGWAGIYIREDLSAGSKMVALKTNLSSFLRREVRSTTNGNKTTAQNPLFANHTWIQIVRTGNNFAYYSSPNGVSWSFVGSATVSMASCAYVGLFAESINGATTVSVSFDNVSVTGTPAPLISSPAGTSAVREGRFTVFPNPSKGNVTLAFSKDVQATLGIDVYNSLGKRVLREEGKDQETNTRQLDLSDLSSGLYFIQVQIPGEAPMLQRLVLTK